MTRKELLRACFLFALSSGLFFFPFFSGQTPFVGDITRSFHPWLVYAAQELQAGRFPLWDPFSACGEPFLANPQIMALSPMASLFWLFPFARAWALFYVLSHALLFTTAYLLARRWLQSRKKGPTHGPALITAMALTWGGFTVSQWEFPSAVGTLSYLPLFFLFGLGGNPWGILLSTALALATGYVPFVHYGVFLALVGLWSRRFPRPEWSSRLRESGLFCLALGGAGLLVLPQLLLSWDAARDSLRTAMGPAGRDFLLTPVFAVKFLIPWITNLVALPFQTPPFGSEYWSVARNWLNTFFVGTGVFLLGLTGAFRSGWRKMLMLGTVVGVSSVLALGIEPFFGWVRSAVPGFRYLTHFSNASVLAVVALSLAAADGARRTIWRNSLLFLFTLGALAVALSLALSQEARQWTLSRLLGTFSLTTSQDRWVASAAGGAAASVILFSAAWFLFHRRRWAITGFFTLMELAALAHGAISWAPADFFHRPLPLVRNLTGTPHRFGISPATMQAAEPLAGDTLLEGYHSLRGALYPNIPLPYRLHQTWANEVIGNYRFVEFRRLVPERPGNSPALDFLGASHLMSIVPLPPPSGLVARAPNALLYRRPDPLPRLTLVTNAVLRSTAEERLSYLGSEWAPHREVVLEEPADSAPPGGVLARWNDDRPGRVHAEGEGEGWLVYSGTHDPGWTAFVNGRQTRLYRANHAFQAVRVPPGPWTAEWVFRPRSFRWGLLGTLLGLSLTVSLAWPRRRRMATE